MDYYLEIRVLPDLEFSQQSLFEALFAKLHRALGQLSNGQVGVSFPCARKTLGDTLRIHGSSEALNDLQALPWLKGLRDYTEVIDIQPIPQETKYRCVSRVQVKSSAERLRRRAIKKGWLTGEQARQRIPISKEQRTHLPFLFLKSLSSGQSFLLFVKQGPIQDKPTSGIFSSYGLSSSATIPWF
ncbi:MULTISPECIES: type I-F CRISPR-associated endoribonuclease Cas6/Csy4 [Photorhabdus]|uniref:Photorhabdus luminescens subsp. laumondii TTO1 complete genome segment 7/17 n=1 Tax=Photorhabdus laumondii subsp. laumondii (strain DSM 15139 / CIP 105565 / TT01) TaxID=243265 RepID=Q7N5Y3_PHOLL|nr:MULTISPECIES: type I-F CRISPR-associated endoribonuclease Cas6/Csy4 [Photorhabdus]AWK41622.1 type I-F CRISPR-associated endoribonuclease Cas6/Csy4 [Photorhabdus laumondii subsp. laumondii]AXG42460.1 type I-F CRISPR-associated endoribonuclease Cas6/Csy4 [Photorhabdus laumondii subsp. laumondii]AXG46946.1 type I-F CRISPR-associated endoribonuclease Cas6/Csy4 [Photorhabdus laumondii subsp. laumondii]MCC8388644.1 type I-F CRISPR-associated endoribonuclease Cas6/Csy4 [Photorhabdus laumondii]MCC8